MTKMTRTCETLRQEIENYTVDERAIWIYYSYMKTKGTRTIDDLTYYELRSIWMKIRHRLGLSSKRLDMKRLITSSIILMHEMGIDEWTVDDLIDAMKHISKRNTFLVPYRKQMKYILSTIPIAEFIETTVTQDNRQRVHLFRYVGE